MSKKSFEEAAKSRARCVRGFWIARHFYGMSREQMANLLGLDKNKYMQYENCQIDLMKLGAESRTLRLGIAAAALNMPPHFLERKFKLYDARAYLHSMRNYMYHKLLNELELAHQRITKLSSQHVELKRYKSAIKKAYERAERKRQELTNYMNGIISLNSERRRNHAGKPKAK